MTPTSGQVAAHAARFPDRMEEGELAIVRRAYAKQVRYGTMRPIRAPRPSEPIVAQKTARYLGMSANRSGEDRS